MSLRSRTVVKKYNPEHDPAKQRETEIAFLRRNRESIESNYAGKWIALQGEKVIASGESLIAAGTLARKAGIFLPFLVYVEEPGTPPFWG